MYGQTNAQGGGTLLENRVSAVETAIPVNELRIYEDSRNTASFSISGLPNVSADRFKYGLLYGGTSASSHFFFLIFIGTDGTVVMREIVNTTGRTFTGEVSNGVLTITSSSTVYGGIRLIWLN